MRINICADVLQDLLEAVEAAIQAGDWKVDGACDPDLAIRRAKETLALPTGRPGNELFVEKLAELVIDECKEAVREFDREEEIIMWIDQCFEEDAK